MEPVERSICLKKPFKRDKTYLLFNNGLFFFRFANTSFGSKWCGLWDRDTKLVEYFAFKVGDDWLSHDNQTAFRYNGISAQHVYHTGLGEVTEKLAMDDGGMVLNLLLPKRADVSLKLAVNLRKRDENHHDRPYEVTTRAGDLQIKNDLAHLHVAYSGSFSKNPLMECHFPGRYAREAGYDWQEDEQTCMVPGTFKAKVKTFQLRLGPARLPTSNRSWSEVVKDQRKLVRSYATNLNIPPELAWKVTCSTLAHAVTDQGFMVGFPYFNEFWTRDFLWMVPSLLHMGMETYVKAELETISRAVTKTGDVPMIIGAKPTCSDSDPLFILAGDTFTRFTGKPPEGFRDAVARLTGKGLSNMRGGLVAHDPMYTWMDTVPREFAIEVQVLWSRAFEMASDLLDNPKLSDEADRLQVRIEDDYWNGDFYLDSLKGAYAFTCNSLLPLLYYSHSSSKVNKGIKLLKSELLTDFGVKAVSRKESHTPETYHEKVWGLTTYWGLKLLASAEPGNAKKVLDAYLKHMDSRNLYGMPETFTADGTPLGASHQLWSVAFIPLLWDAINGLDVGNTITMPFVQKDYRVGRWTLKMERR